MLMTLTCDHRCAWYVLSQLSLRGKVLHFDPETLTSVYYSVVLFPSLGLFIFAHMGEKTTVMTDFLQYIESDPKNNFYGRVFYLETSHVYRKWYTDISLSSKCGPSHKSNALCAKSAKMRQSQTQSLIDELRSILFILDHDQICLSGCRWFWTFGNFFGLFRNFSFYQTTRLCRLMSRCWALSVQTSTTQHWSSG